MICELCGNEVPYLKPLLIEGSILKVCSTCAKFGKETEPPSSSSATSDTGTKAPGQARRHGGLGYTYGHDQDKDEIKRRMIQDIDRWTKNAKKEVGSW